MSDKKNDRITTAAAVAAFKLPERITTEDIPHSFSNGSALTIELDDRHVSSRDEAVDLFTEILKANPTVNHAIFRSHEGEYSFDVSWYRKKKSI